MNFNALYIGDQNPFYDKLKKEFEVFTFALSDKPFDAIKNNSKYDLIFYETNEESRDLLMLKIFNKYLSKEKTVIFIINKNDIDIRRFIRLGAHDIFDMQADPRVIFNRFEFIKSHYNSLKTKSNDKLDLFRLPLWKRTFDILLSVLALIAWSPVFILILLMLGLKSTKEILVSSPRVATGYKIFDILFFRNTGGFPEQFLHRTGLDKLPHLFNILKGDISLVGNRPVQIKEAEQLTTDEWAKRFLAPTGITGLWRVKRKKKLSPDEQKKLDIRYAEKFSLWYDICIMIRTFPILINPDKEN